MQEKLTIWNKNFVLLSIGNLLMATSFYFLLPTLPSFIVNSLGENKGRVGLALAAYTLSSLLMRPIAGNLLDNYGRKALFLIGFAVFALSFGLYALVGSFSILLILRLFHGISWGVTSTGASTVLIDLIPAEKRGEGIGIYGLSMTLAMALGPVIAQILLPSYGYQFIFVFGMALAVVGLILAIMIKYPEFVPPAGEKKGISLKKLVAKKVIPAASLQLLFGICYGAVVSYVTLYQQEKHIQDKGLFFILLAGGIAISRIVAGKLFDKKGPSIILSLGFIFMSVGLFVLGLSNDLIQLYVSALLIGLGAGVMMPTLQAMANNLVDKFNRGAANATIITAFDLGIGAGSIIVGVLSDRLSISFAYQLCAVIMIVALVLFRIFVLKNYLKNKLT